MEEIDRLTLVAMYGGKKAWIQLIETAARLEMVKYGDIGVETI